jgi:hypothetical protein
MGLTPTETEEEKTLKECKELQSAYEAQARALISWIGGATQQLSGKIDGNRIAELHAALARIEAEQPAKYVHVAVPSSRDCLCVRLSDTDARAHTHTCRQGTHSLNDRLTPSLSVPIRADAKGALQTDLGAIQDKLAAKSLPAYTPPSDLTAEAVEAAWAALLAAQAALKEGLQVRARAAALCALSDDHAYDVAYVHVCLRVCLSVSLSVCVCLLQCWCLCAFVCVVGRWRMRTRLQRVPT